MDNTIVFIGISVLIGFIGSLFLNKVNQWVQIIIAGSLAVYFMILYFERSENSSLIMILLAASWIVKIIKAMKENKNHEKIIS